MNASNTPQPVKLSLEGSLTIYQAAEHKARLLDALSRTETLDLDLANIGEIDTAGLQLLILAKRESAQAGKVLSIVAHSASVQECIEFTRLAAYFGDPLVTSAR